MLIVASVCQFGCQRDTENWQHLDLDKDGYFGVSANRAYEELLKDKKATPVIVAIMDSGFDTEHEDLQSVLWVNEGEIPDNGMDDDGNGYIDDVHGWNFTGSTPSSVKYGTSTLTCLVVRDQERFGDRAYSDIPETEREDFETFQRNKAELAKKRREAEDNLAQVEKFKVSVDEMRTQLTKESPKLKDIRAYKPRNAEENDARSFLNAKMQRKTFGEVYEEDVTKMIERYRNQLDYWYNINYTAPSLDDDHPDNLRGPMYGNGGLKGPEPDHGTHVAGIIGADRHNKRGIRGIADQVQLMPLLFSKPDGREADLGVAQAIRYAADHGAKVINMSFGSEYTWDRKVVDDAVKYALSKDVLIIHAAGNHSRDLDEWTLYPNRYFADGGEADAWLTVGASDFANDETLRATFSNYGSKKVDLFAPGVRINSTFPGSTYKRNDGTSMAAPVVAGVAALVRSYYPELSATQVKDILMQSVIKVEQLQDRCVSGGVVNAYQAIKQAEKINN